MLPLQPGRDVNSNEENGERVDFKCVDISRTSNPSRKSDFLTSTEYVSFGHEAAVPASTFLQSPLEKSILECGFFRHLGVKKDFEGSDNLMHGSCLS